MFEVFGVAIIALIVGLMLGLSASGLYSGTKNIVEKEDE